MKNIKLFEEFTNETAACNIPAEELEETLQVDISALHDIIPSSEYANNEFKHAVIVALNNLYKKYKINMRIKEKMYKN